jgi:hypothetical protein
MIPTDKQSLSILSLVHHHRNDRMHLSLSSSYFTFHIHVVAGITVDNGTRDLTKALVSIAIDSLHQTTIFDVSLFSSSYTDDKRGAIARELTLILM